VSCRAVTKSWGRTKKKHQKLRGNHIKKSWIRLSRHLEDRAKASQVLNTSKELEGGVRVGCRRRRKNRGEKRLQGEVLQKRRSKAPGGEGLEERNLCGKGSGPARKNELCPLLYSLSRKKGEKKFSSWTIRSAAHLRTMTSCPTRKKNGKVGQSLVEEVRGDKKITKERRVRRRERSQGICESCRKGEAAYR